MTPSVLKNSQPAVHPGIDAVIAALARRRCPAVLDSADHAAGRGRYTIAAFDPVDVASFPAEGPDPFQGMRRRLECTRIAPPPGERHPGGFNGGWIGYLAYEAGRHVERLPATTQADIPLPVARFALYDVAAIHDATTGRWSIVAADLPPGAVDRASPPVEQRIQAWLDLLSEAREQAIPPAPELPAAVDNMTREAYLQRVSLAIDYIAAGDIFQVNLARRRTFARREPTVDTYRRLRQTNPAAYAAYIAWSDKDGSETSGAHDDQCAILSASPELFLHLNGSRVITRPIKGTRPRVGDEVIDEAHRRELAASPKDRAELAMIVDLERNDLGRVCRFGSIRVIAPPDSPAAPYALEEHPTVHHLVATIVGELKPDRDPIDLLIACFPGGSITGAPKIRAMEIIDELEPHERSVYTGAIGYFSLDGGMMMNIPIRTIIAAGEHLHVYAGGGIVADSVPEHEFDETNAKALGMCRALGAEAAPASPLTPAASHGNVTT